jgi:hypothetical protein
MGREGERGQPAPFKRSWRCVVKGRGAARGALGHGEGWGRQVGWRNYEGGGRGWPATETRPRRVRAAHDASRGLKGG